MLPTRFRLKDKKEFNEVFRRGKTTSNEVLTMKHKKISREELKVGFSVGLKFSKKSSERNKIKRWMREAVRPVISRIKPGQRIIFLVNSKFPYKQMSYSLIQEKIGDLLRKAKLLR